MELIEYEMDDVEEPGWHFAPVKLRKVNLIVGDSGTGKTRFLNTIFNLGVSAVRNAVEMTGRWRVLFRADGKTFEWKIHLAKLEDRVFVQEEWLTLVEEHDVRTIIVEREHGTLKFNGVELPKLTDNITSITLLKDEEIIRPIYEGFSSFRRRFPGESDNPLEILPFDETQLNAVGRDLQKLTLARHSPSIRLYLLKKFHGNLYTQLVKLYTEVFDFVTDVDVLDIREVRPDLILPGFAPVFCIKERDVESWVDYTQLSSGMRKVLDILTDVLASPPGWVQLIDEYENSLGFSAINFLPELLERFGAKDQFIITSHHPYLINQIGVENWLVFHRTGTDVKIRSGEIYAGPFKMSKQQAFIQLINDPFYLGGVE